jgi:hypothetical protein
LVVRALSEESVSLPSIYDLAFALFLIVLDSGEKEINTLRFVVNSPMRFLSRDGPREEDMLSTEQKKKLLIDDLVSIIFTYPVDSTNVLKSLRHILQNSNLEYFNKKYEEKRKELPMVEEKKKSVKKAETKKGKGKEKEKKKKYQEDTSEEDEDEEY